MITELGEGVTQLNVGDRVILSCVSSCGSCTNCHQGLFSHCLSPEGKAEIGWIFGDMIDGTQAEYVRVPFAENSVYKVPEGVTDAEGILISDILPTGFEIGVQHGHVKPGDVVAVIGSGPVGLASVMTAQLYGPSRVIAIDLDDADSPWPKTSERRIPSTPGLRTGKNACSPLAMAPAWMSLSRLPFDKFVTHEFTFDQTEEAYEVFGNAGKHNSLKVLIH